MPPEENKAILQRAIKNFNAGNLDEYLTFYDPQCALHGYPGMEPGFEGIKKFYAGLHAAFPDSHITLEGIVAEGEQIAARFTMRGTHRGNFNSPGEFQWNSSHR